MSIRRVVAPETLDHLAPSDPAAVRSRRDLMRVHRAMGTRGLMAGGWRSLAPPARAQPPMRILELGAGDGSLLLGLARELAPDWPPVELTLLDRQDIVTFSTLAGFAAVGWAARVQVADVLDWAASSEESCGTRGTAPNTAQPVPVIAPRWDLITASLFLHHFDGSELDLLLKATALRCDRFFACEPRRSWPALAGSHLVGALGANAVTRQDAVVSVHAGFRDNELTSRWPMAGGPWQTAEHPAGLFSHSFSARRVEVSA